MRICVCVCGGGGSYHLRKLVCTTSGLLSNLTLEVSCIKGNNLCHLAHGQLIKEELFGQTSIGNTNKSL